MVTTKLTVLPKASEQFGFSPNAQSNLDALEGAKNPDSIYDMSDKASYRDATEADFYQPPETPSTPTPQISTEGTVESPSVVSTDSMRDQLKQAEADLLKMKEQIDTQTAAERTQDTTQEVTPPTPTKEGESVDPFLAFMTETEKRIKEAKADFDKYYSRSSALLKSQVRSIQKQFDVRRDQAEEVARSASAASQVLGSRTGRLRYAPELQRGIMTGQENALIKTLAEVDALEAAAIANAEQAAYNRDYTTFLDEIDNISTIQKEREATLAEIETAMEKENERRQTEVEQTKNESLIIEQFSLGVTNPIEVFQALEGKVPYDTIVSYATTLPEAQAAPEPIELDRYNMLVDPVTGAIIARGAGVAGGAGVVGLGGSSAQASGASTPGTQNWISDKDLQNMNDVERDFVNKVLRQLPTKLKDSEQEKIERQKEALFDFRRGRSFQEVVDEMNGYVVTGDNKALADVFRGLSVGSGVDLQLVSAALNNGYPEQAMTTIENAKLSDADGFFSGVDDSRNVVSQADKVLSLMNSMSKETLEKLGGWDGREFKVKRFTNITDAEDLKIQNLTSAMQLLNAPLRLAIAGTAVTSEEMARIEEFQAAITDQPDIAKAKVEELKSSILNFHNQARTQRGLPQVDFNQLTNNEERLRLYEGMATEKTQALYNNVSNSDLLFGEGGDGGGESGGGDIWSTIGVGEVVIGR